MQPYDAEDCVVPLTSFFRRMNYRRAQDAINALLIGATGSERNKLELISDWVEDAKKEAE